MNYIKRLESENKVLLQGLLELKRYVQSDKFTMSDNMVNCGDIVLRINETIQLFRESVNESIDEILRKSAE